ncbi:MAG TPA: hypothetical protein VFW98_15305, partial [Gemmatimonadaceae bacterium]|nr:hypothetical protein [Gemmatimonadaceae bacterium]
MLRNSAVGFAGAALLLCAHSTLAAQAAPVARRDSVSVSELHYDNRGRDTGEAIEIAGPAGTRLAGWTVLLYNGSTGTVYSTQRLGGSIPPTCGAR